MPIQLARAGAAWTFRRRTRAFIGLSLAAVAAGWVSLLAMYRWPDAALPNVLVHAAALPWHASAALGAAAWARGSARTADPLRHYFVVSAGGAAAGLAAGAALAVAAGSGPVDGSSFGPAAPVCAVAVLMHVAALAAGLSLGTIFPGLLPVAAAAVSAALLEAPPGPVRLAAAIGAAALGWLVSVGAAALLIFA